MVKPAKAPPSITRTAATPRYTQSWGSSAGLPSSFSSVETIGKAFVTPRWRKAHRSSLIKDKAPGRVEEKLLEASEWLPLCTGPALLDDDIRSAVVERLRVDGRFRVEKL